MKRASHLCACAIALLLAIPAGAQTLYKLIDRNGKVTYSESAPKQFDGQVIPLNIDPNANTATLPKPPPPPPDRGRDASPAPAPKEKARETSADRVQAARERLDAARKALKNATDNPAEGDVTWIGKVGGGARPVPSEEYQGRIARLEAAVKKAEEELRVAEAR